MKKSLWIAALAALIDRAAKLAWAAADFVLIPGVLGVRGTRNTGMAFGMLGGRPYLLAALTAGVMIALFVYLRKKRLPGYAWAGFGNQRVRALFPAQRVSNGLQAFPCARAPVQAGAILRFG